jgi:hypothetical protein
MIKELIESSLIWDQLRQFERFNTTSTDDLEEILAFFHEFNALKFRNFGRVYGYLNAIRLIEMGDIHYEIFENIHKMYYISYE